jgi:hypothetical protein
MVLQGYSSTLANVALRGIERQPRADKGAHRRHRTLTHSRRSPVEASRFFAVTSVTSAAAAASRLIAASCAHPIFGHPVRFFITAGNALKCFSDTKMTPKRRPRGGWFARNWYSRVHSRAPPLTLTRTARGRTSFIAASRGWACNATRAVRLSGVEGAFAVHREVTCACPPNGLVRPRCACRGGTAAHAHECADGSGRSGASRSADGRAGARAHEQ